MYRKPLQGFWVLGETMDFCSSTLNWLERSKLKSQERRRRLGGIINAKSIFESYPRPELVYWQQIPSAQATRTRSTVIWIFTSGYPTPSCLLYLECFAFYALRYLKSLSKFPQMRNKPDYWLPTYAHLFRWQDAHLQVSWTVSLRRGCQPSIRFR